MDSDQDYIKTWNDNSTSSNTDGSFYYINSKNNESCKLDFNLFCDNLEILHEYRNLSLNKLEKDSYILDIYYNVKNFYKLSQNNQILKNKLENKINELFETNINIPLSIGSMIYNHFLNIDVLKNNNINYKFLLNKFNIYHYEENELHSLLKNDTNQIIIFLKEGDEINISKKDYKKLYNKSNYFYLIIYDYTGKIIEVNKIPIRHILHINNPYTGLLDMFIILLIFLILYFIIYILYRLMK